MSKTWSILAWEIYLLSQSQSKKLSNIHERLCFRNTRERWFALSGAGQGLHKEVAWQIEIYLYKIDTDFLLIW